jgi:hypothetical protein
MGVGDVGDNVGCVIRLNHVTRLAFDHPPTVSIVVAFRDAQSQSSLGARGAGC